MPQNTNLVVFSNIVFLELAIIYVWPALNGTEFLVTQLAEEEKVVVLMNLI